MDNENYNGQTVPLAYHEMCMTRNHMTVRNLIIGWAVSVVLVVCAFVYLWMQYDYVSTTDNTGVYVLMDSEGNVIANDLGPDDVIHIMETIANGQYSKETNTD